MSLSNVCVITHLERLRHNLRTLKLRHPLIMPVIKADAYGHGLLPVAKVLIEENIQHIAVGTVNDGLLLRQKGYSPFLLALLGPFSKQDVDIAINHQIIPLIYDIEGLETVAAQNIFLKNRKPMPIAIKIDTGMNRLGFCCEEYGSLIDYLRNTPSVTPILLVSHLASSDRPEYDSFTLKQIALFKEAYETIRTVFPNIKTSLTNSPGLLAWPGSANDLARPGIALYGSNPLYGTSRSSLGSGLLPVMEVNANILAVNKIIKGCPIGYGCTYVAPQDMNVAVIGAGYADGYSRMLSNRGWVLINGKRARVVGQICMQMFMVDVTDHSNVYKGDKAYLLGGEGIFTIKPEEVAEWWGTIPYEVFCSFGNRQKIHSFD